MRTAILLSVLAALAAVALAAPPSPSPQQPAEQPSQPPVRHRRFVLLGWDLGRFLADLDRQVHRAWAAGTHWARRLLHWSHGRLPQHETVYDLSLPGGGVGVVRIISFSAQHPRRGPLVWDGKRLAWQHQQHGDGNLLTLDHNGMHHAIRLDALARYLRDVPAGSKVRAEVLGSGWRKLRIVLHVVGKHGKEDASKSVSILVSELIEKHWSHGHSASSHGHRKSSKSHEKSSKSHEKSSHSHGKSSQSYEKSSNSIESHSKKSSHNEVGHKSSGSEESHKHDKSNHHLAVQLEKHHSKESRRSSSHSSGSSTSASGKSKKSSTGLVWDGQSLSWADGVGAAGKSKKVNRRLRITQDGVTHVIPLSVVAQHLGDVAAGSEISLEIVGKKLKNLQIVLHVHGAQGQGADKTITLKAIDLIREIDEKRATVLPGRKTKKGKSIPLLGSILFTTTTTPRPGR